MPGATCSVRAAIDAERPVPQTDRPRREELSVDIGEVQEDSLGAGERAATIERITIGGASRPTSTMHESTRVMYTESTSLGLQFDITH